MSQSKQIKCHDYEMGRFGILNPWGQIWTVETFDTEDEAKDHVAAFFKGHLEDVSRFKVVPVKVTVALAYQ